MQIKSWQIALLTIPIAAISETYKYATTIRILNIAHTAPTEVFIQSLLSSAVFFGLPVVLLYIEKTKKSGALLSIIVGLVYTFMSGITLVSLIGYKALTSISLSGLVLIFAGIYYFWKKA